MTLSNKTSRMRIFAGPNGSGKSTIKSLIKPGLLGIYINPDDIEAEIKRSGFLDLKDYGVMTESAEILGFFRNSSLLEKADLLLEAEALSFNDNKLSFFEVDINSYFASVAADFIRQKMLFSRQSFTFETVMSAPDKVKFLAKAQKADYRTYLYFIATNNPIINISRVKNRVKEGGHDVPEEKIVSRYYRCLDLLFEAVKNTNRAYIFDNSEAKVRWIAEITDAETIEIKDLNIPTWFDKYILSKIT